MKVAVLTPSVSRALGGIFEVERALAQAVARHPGVAVAAYGLDDAETAADLPGWAPVPVHTARRRGPYAIGYSPDLQKLVMASGADIVHLHSLWMYSSVIAHRWSRRTGRPYMTTIHGMLEPWAVGNSRLKKRLVLALYERAALRGAHCLHVNTLAELQSVRDFGLSGPFCVLPNGVDLPARGPGPALAADSPLVRLKQSGAKILLYLSRLHPKKNLAATLEAFAAAAPDHPDWHFAIVGWGADDYRDALIERARSLGVASRVHFLGSAFGDQKAAILHASDAFILASHSEGFPMAVLEAMAYAKPALMTAMCNFQAGFDAGAAIEVDVDARSIEAGLRRVMDMTAAERMAIGENGRALVERDYQWDAVGAQLLDVYRWLVGGGAPPASVYP